MRIPGLPPTGSAVELIDVGEREPFARAEVHDARETTLRLICSATLGSRLVTVRWWDDDDASWEAHASVLQGDPTLGPLELEVTESWHSALLRRAARVDAGREAVELLTLGGDGRVIRRVRVLCLDMSTIGCRVAGTGPALTDGDLLQVASVSIVSPGVIDARVVRCEPVPFGGWLAGLEFLPHSPAERAALVAWRDRAALRSAG